LVKGSIVVNWHAFGLRERKAVRGDVAVEGYLGRSSRYLRDDLAYPSGIKDELLQVHGGSTAGAFDGYLAKNPGDKRFCTDIEALASIENRYLLRGF